MLWQSTPIQLDDGIRADVTVTDAGRVVLSAYDSTQTLLVEINATAEQADDVIKALTEGATRCLQGRQ